MTPFCATEPGGSQVQWAARGRLALAIVLVLIGPSGLAASACGGGPRTTSLAGVSPVGMTPSCQAGANSLAECGRAGESCCASPLVVGGTFYRSYDGVSFTDRGYPATVSDFRLDAYEVTVGRFRQFVAAVVKGWRPPLGAGKHTHLSGGAGVNGGTEAGWLAAWTGVLPDRFAAWTASLQCSGAFDTWTPSPGPNENLPINCVSWYEAYAFCTWDGGFLPSEAEWNYVAAGGSEQRVYPWSIPPPSAAVDHSYASYDCSGQSCAFSDILAVGSDPKGIGKWGQADLGGNMWEWNLDASRSPYLPACHDCADLGPSANRVLRGGAFNYGVAGLLASVRDANDPASHLEMYGARCARSP